MIKKIIKKLIFLNNIDFKKKTIYTIKSIDGYVCPLYIDDIKTREGKH